MFNKWCQTVEQCRNSGQKVSVWCKENEIPVSTYYGWQRKVFETVKEEVGFAEIPQEIVNSSLNEVVAEIETGDVKIKVYAGADEVKQISSRQFRWLMEALSIDKPKAHKATYTLTEI